MKMYYSILFKVLSCLCLIVFYFNISCGQTVRLEKSEGFIQTNDYVRLHYQILGEGKDTILVIHGGTSFGSSYLIPDLTPLAAHHTLLFFDQAGAGYSSIIEDTARYNIQGTIQDIETIRKHFRIQKINLLGHSTGGLICGYYASLYPERTQSMILISPLPLSASWMANYNTDKKHDSTSLFILRQNRKKYRSSPIDSIKACWDYYALWARGQFPTYAQARNAWGNICNCNQANLLSPYSYYLLKSLGNWDIAGRLTKVKSRVLILGGEQDEIPYESFQQWNKSLSNSLLLKFKASAHMPHIDEPEAFFSAIEQFLINKWPNDTTIEYRGSGVILPMDNKGTTYIKSRVQVIEIIETIEFEKYNPTIIKTARKEYESFFICSSYQSLKHLTRSIHDRIWSLLTINSLKINWIKNDWWKASTYNDIRHHFAQIRKNNIWTPNTQHRPNFIFGNIVYTRNTCVLSLY